MILVAYWHGLRASEVVGHWERQHGIYADRKTAEARTREVGGSSVKEVLWKKGNGKPLYAVVTAKPVLWGGIRFRDVRDGYLMVQRGKGSEATLQPLQEHDNPLLNERAAFEEWFRQGASHGKKGGAKEMQQSSKIVAFSPNDRLFPVTRGQFLRLVKTYAAQAGIAAGGRYRTKRKTHALKHSIAKHLVSDGMPVNELQLFLGWKKLETAAIYLLPDQDEVSLRAGKIIREKRAFRRELQQNLFIDPADKLQKPN